MTYSKGDSGLSFSSHKPKSKVEKGLEASATASRAHAGTGLLKLSSIYIEGHTFVPCWWN